MDVIAIEEGLVKRYGELLALDHFDLHVAAGEIFGLLGPNGSGKTTSINCMLTLLTYDRGSIRLFGESMAPTRYDLKRRIGIVPQQVAVIDELTVRENIDYFCSLYVNDRAGDARSWTRRSSSWSSRNSSAFAPASSRADCCAASTSPAASPTKPELIFFDEPTVAVDPQSRNAILNGIQRLRAEGATVVYTSHYMEEVEQICDRVMIMDHGRARSRRARPMSSSGRSARGERIVIELEGPSGPRARPGSRASDGGVLPTRELDRLRALPHVLDVSLAGNLLTVSCEASEHNLTDVLASLRAGNARLGRITCAPPTLNDVFLEITGRELRD